MNYKKRGKRGVKMITEEMSKDDEECAAMLKEIKTLRGIK